jgi:putative flippase GtrA
LAKRVMVFGAISGTGLALDFCIFLLLANAGDVAPGIANAISGAAAVTFVFFVSVRRVFQYGGGFLVGRFVAYLVYHAFGIPAGSAAVAYLSQHHLVPWLAKIAVLPFTFIANYLFMSLLMRDGRRSDAEPGSAGL